MPNVKQAHAGVTNEKRTEFKAAKLLKDAYPEWAQTMTPAEAEAYVELNVTDDLASAKNVLKEMAQITIINTMAIRWLFRYFSPK